ncbi:hypothetical protein AcV7_004436 [Taiwanofungus camphoratus]|nr:hypothetical protein AcV7_004436 [Antrodia cinnamomea]
MSTPTPGKGRQSGIPTPGKASSIPTPGRLRSTSSATQYPPPLQDEEYISRAFADAIKANDPAQHRSSRASDVSTSSLSPSSIVHPSQTGRRSVVGRPSSVASSSSAMSSAPSQTPASSTRTPTARPTNRQSDVSARSSSRAGRTFDIGDNVRIESLGFEGTLRYLGEIDGKPGHWAGVELGGGFAGKGKNNGIVNGKQYFVCPPNCGVFVAATKLSPPTVGYTSRPSSVASSRNGRMTPSLSQSGRMTPSASTTISAGRKTPSISMSNGRITPSLSNGRVTPSASSGRRTPGIPTPSARSRSTAYSSVNTVTPIRNAPIQSTITPGSRASKYVGMTARQLDSRESRVGSPSRRSAGTQSPTRSTGFSSPTQASRHLSSPIRGTSSPFNTPKAVPGGRISNIGVGMPSTTTPSKARPSFNTPRPRIPSAVAMPPPASPSATSLGGRSISLNDFHLKDQGGGALSDLQMTGKALQDRISDLMMSGKVPSGSRPDSSASVASSNHVELQGQVDRLQARLDSLENENQQLQAAASVQDKEKASRIERLLTEQKQNAARITELEALARTNERLVTEREATIESLERAAQQTTMDIDKVKGDAEARIRDVHSKLEDKEALVAQLKELIEAKEGLQNENDAVLRAKNAEIVLLEARVQKAYAELVDERKDLGGQVDELRKAGQETIALYEERLSAADTRRYELEDLISSLEEQVRAQAVPPSPSSATRFTSAAAEIDNEALREQVQHLQSKIVLLEDQLEDARVAFDNEESAVRERIKRYKDREDNLKKEIGEGKKEIESVLKTEASARQRVEEMEEALRENTVALENARAEIEGLRNEVTLLEGIPAGTGASSSSERLAEVAQRSANERARLTEEIAQLKQQLADSRTNTGGASMNGELNEDTSTLKFENASLQQLCEEREAQLASERKAIEDLRNLVDERSAELDAMRKKLNRDLPVNSLDATKSPLSPSKHDLAAARDEITGLKHIVQELQKENSAAAQRNKVLESENRLLLSETEQLREDLRALEENVEQSILREEQALVSGDESPSMTSSDVASLQKSLKDLKVKYEAELEQLRKKQADGEMKSARTIHDLNKEIGELETLIESKIYREDELERELERLKDKLARTQKKSSKNERELPEDARSRKAPGAEPAAASEVCEICERPGHDIFTCDLLKGEAGAPLRLSAPPVSVGGEELFCEDCEGRGHTAANCPHSLDVF